MFSAALVAIAGGIALALPGGALGQEARPPTGGVNRFPMAAPPSGLDRPFLGTWSLTWQDPADPACPCHGVLTIKVEPDGSLKGYWPLRGGMAVLEGGVAFDQNAWAGRFAQPDDGSVDFPIKGHFRLESRGGAALTGSYQRDGTAIPYSWSATRP
jgi:hypothetical protein